MVVWIRIVVRYMFKWICGFFEAIVSGKRYQKGVHFIFILFPDLKVGRIGRDILHGSAFLNVSNSDLAIPVLVCRVPTWLFA
jgi:hypothetical protein